MLGSNPELLRLWHWQLDALTTWIDLIYNRLDLIYSRLDLIHKKYRYAVPVSKNKYGTGSWLSWVPYLSYCRVLGPDPDYLELLDPDLDPALKIENLFLYISKKMPDSPSRFSITNISANSKPKSELNTKIERGLLPWRSKRRRASSERNQEMSASASPLSPPAEDTDAVSEAQAWCANEKISAASMSRIMPVSAVSSPVSPWYPCTRPGSPVPLFLKLKIRTHIWIRTHFRIRSGSAAVQNNRQMRYSKRKKCATNCFWTLQLMVKLG